jgi:hypothetical protein
MDSSIKDLTIERGKAILAVLKKAARECGDASSLLVKREEGGRMNRDRRIRPSQSPPQETAARNGESLGPISI